VTLHGCDKHLIGKTQMASVEAADVHAGPLHEVEGLGQHVAGVEPLAAHTGGALVEAGHDPRATLILRDDDLLFQHVTHIVVGFVDDDRRAEHAVALRHLAGT
jgi:hypothetical protein